MPDNHGIHVDFLLPWTRRIQDSCPSLSFDIYCEGSKYGLLEQQFAQVSSGIVDIAHSPASLPIDHFPLTNLINLPFLVKDAQQASEYLWAAYEPYLKREFSPLHVLALHADSGGVLHMRDGAIKSLEDFVGKRIRMPPGSLSETMAAIGAIPVHLPPPAIAQAARADEIDGAIMAWDVLAYTQTQDIFRYHYRDVFYVSPLYLVMNAQSYALLDKDERRALDEYSGAALTKYFGKYWQAWSSSGRLLAEGDGHVVGQLPAQLMTALREAATRSRQHHIDRLMAQGHVEAAEVIEIFQFERNA